MMKKTLPIVIIAILILSGLSIATSPENQTNTNCTKKTNIIPNRVDELDQQQILQNAYLDIGASLSVPQWNLTAAQSFIPTKPVITHVEILIKESDGFDPIFPYFVAIRDNLTGEDLAKVGVSPNEIGDNFSWVEFDFVDIPITIGQTYYIFSYTSNVEGNRYTWGEHYPDVYPNGTAYWRGNPENPHGDMYGDFAFKTYGRVNNPPETPEQPDGPTEGIVNIEYTYTTSATDPDGDPIEYGWDWDGDDTVDEWTTEETASHDWNEAGSYEIQVKARDEVGDESNFSQPLTVEIIGETEPDIEFIKSGMALSVSFKNIGDYEAVNVVWNVNVTGGIFGLIDKHMNGEAEILTTDDEISVKLTPIYGLGPLKVVATVSAANAEEVTEIWEGFIIFVFILGV